MDIQDLLRQMGETESTDRTRYVRIVGGQEKLDYEVTERVSFASAYPETIRELRIMNALACGHVVDPKTNPFGGYCQGKSLFGKRCGRDYCSSFCAAQCVRCGASIGGCCARVIDGLVYCRSCKRALTTRQRLRASASFLLAPFLSETFPDD